MGRLADDWDDDSANDNGDDETMMGRWWNAAIIQFADMKCEIKSFYLASISFSPN